MLPTLFILRRAYSLGGGTDTGIEAVSNGVQILNETALAIQRRLQFAGLEVVVLPNRVMRDRLLRAP